MALVLFLQKRVLAIFWLVLGLHCLFQYLHLPYVAATKPFLVPLLMVFLLTKDDGIGVIAGKFIFYVGMFLALFGDVLLISINDTFFISGMVAFMLMNIAYSISFFLVDKLRFRKSLPVFVGAALLVFTACKLYNFLSGDMAQYRFTVLLYTCTVLLMCVAALAAATGERYGKIALQYFVSGAVVFLVENILVGFNRFIWNEKDIYILIMFLYGLAQYLFVRGIGKTYVNNEYRTGEYRM